MELKIGGGFITATGDPIELAMYTHALLEIFRRFKENEQHENDKFMDEIIAELLKNVHISEDVKDE